MGQRGKFPKNILEKDQFMQNTLSTESVFEFG